MSTLPQILQHFFSLTVDIAPYFVAGTALAAVVDTYFDSNKLLKKMGNGRTAVVLAVLLGALLPGCACAALPLAAALIKAGAGLGPVAAFLMAAPLLSPQTVVLTWAMLGPKFALARIFFALSGPILAGLLIQYFEKTGVTGFSLPPKQPPQNNTCSNDSNSCHCCAPRRTFFKSFIVLTGDLSKYFLLGMAIAVLFTWLVPTHAIKEHLGSGPLAYLLALIVGIPIYVCEGEEIPLTFALLSKGVSPGPAFTFMLGSVGTCIPTIAIAFSLLGKKPTWTYLAMWAVFALFAGLLFNLL